MAREGAWRGSKITAENIAKACSEGLIGKADEVEARIARKELMPMPRQGEYVIFLDHLDHGLALSASTFFHSLLDEYGLQPHHLGANSISQISAFVAACEAYLGVPPTV